MRNIINMTLEIPVERIADTLCSALEGGSNYWYMLEEKREPKLWTIDERPVYKTEEEAEANIHTHYAHYYPLNEGGALIFSVISEERDEEARKEEESKRYTLDLEAINNGLQAWAMDAMKEDGDKTRTAHPCHLADFIKGDGDAITADVFLQYCLFGKVIYG